jgi:predicted  nucleic acid-binding Zn-ribbon protein
MKPELEAVVRLQSLDDRAADLQKEIDTLPKHIALIEKKLDAHTRQLDSDRVALAANLKQRKQFEDDVKVQQQKISKLKDQMLQAKTNEQYRAFQHEIDFCEAAIRSAEDKVLDLMGAAEPLEKAVKQAEAALTIEKKSVAAEKLEAENRTAVDKEALARVVEERKELTGSIDPKLLAHYERSRKRWHGSAVSDATEGRCAECQMLLRPQYFQELKNGDRVLPCESCGRILYYSRPVDLSSEMQQA